ncbi:L,D-transpeptidase [Afipia felis]|uniref:L,D-TPase catalytic domain-containing protein n=2 Tax=Afipia felis TaxID=1035 RepID=A0ABN0I8B0_AFIFE|nr:L,D-transpeptidase [Afipia felis]EKS29085.1 hypothetical protein HMPREF9697_01613 [Afipia felis ATCC 53690]SUU77792.1 Probable L,D-transpeptidase YbiS precursor [Afipia felis]SUU85857.1 Probable L,D-transpeptidase YbiS precursor [Afipia felis]
MSNRLSTSLLVLAASLAGVPAVQAQTYQQPGYYGQQPAPYSEPAQQDRMPDFDRVGDRGDGSLSPPGFQQPGPPQPGYQQSSAQQPAYPQGPILSPDDPRYGRPPDAPPLNYSNNGQGAPQPQNASGYDSPRPPGALDASGAPRPAVDSQGRPMTVATLPADDQPETGPRQELPPRLRRQEVNYQTKEPAGTIIVDTPNTQLYYILGHGRAIRYGVRVGRDGFTWTGVQKITRKAEWPDWHPPAEMIERQPYLPRFMAGGDGNPLGARAMYLGSTVYRIHGTNQPSTIGKFVSSGCIGMLNEDVEDLFDRVKVGTRVVVLPGGAPPAVAATQPAVDTAGYGRSANAAPQGSVGNGAAGQPNASANLGVPNQGPAVVPPLPSPVTVR